VIFQHDQVPLLVEQQQPRERAQVDLRDLLLLGAGHGGIAVGPPHAVEVVVVRAVHPEQLLELPVRLRGVGHVRGVRAVVGVVALEGEDVPVPAAVDEVIAVRYHGGAGDWLVLPVGGRDRRHRRERKSVGPQPGRAVQGDDRAARIGLHRGQLVEQRGVADPLAAPRVPDDQDAVEVDLPVQRMADGPVPDPELFEVLEVNDGPSVVFAEVETVEEIRVDGAMIPCEASSSQR
jgi:hypothetical protein